MQTALADRGVSVALVIPGDVTAEAAAHPTPARATCSVTPSRASSAQGACHPPARADRSGGLGEHPRHPRAGRLVTRFVGAVATPARASSRATVKATVSEENATSRRAVRRRSTGRPDNGDAQRRGDDRAARLPAVRPPDVVAGARVRLRGHVHPQEAPGQADGGGEREVEPERPEVAVEGGLEVGHQGLGGQEPPRHREHDRRPDDVRDHHEAPTCAFVAARHPCTVPRSGGRVLPQPIYQVPAVLATAHRAGRPQRCTSARVDVGDGRGHGRSDGAPRRALGGRGRRAGDVLRAALRPLLPMLGDDDRTFLDRMLREVRVVQLAGALGADAGELGEVVRGGGQDGRPLQSSCRRPTGRRPRPARPCASVRYTFQRNGSVEAPRIIAPIVEMGLSVGARRRRPRSRRTGGHAVRAEDVLHEERHVEADEHQPEVHLAQPLVQHPAGQLREPVVDAGEDAEHAAAEEHVVEVRDHEVRVR